MESERSELAGLNKMKEIEILNELMCTSQTSANYYILHDVRSIPHEVGCHKGPRQTPSRNLNRTHEEQIA
jgi:hypothetical protein